MTAFAARRSIALPALCVLAACSSPTEPEDTPFVGQLGFGDLLSFEVPDTVSVGVAFEVTFETWGANSCYSVSRTDVSVDDRTATVTPYDIRTGNGCFSMGRALPHSASITFDRAGTGLVRVRGSDQVLNQLVVIR